MNSSNFSAVVAGLDGLHRVVETRGVGVRQRGVGLGHAVPALVAVHGEIAAADGGNRHVLRQCGAQTVQVVDGGLRRGIAAVGEGVEHGRHAVVVQDRGQRGGVVLVRMHPSRRDQPEQVAGAFRLAELADEPGQRCGLGEAAVGDGVADAHQLLVYHPAGADVHVADLRVAHLPVGQADIAAGGVQEGVWTGLPQPGESGGLGEADGVVLGCVAPAEAVEDYQHHRTNRLRHGTGPPCGCLAPSGVAGVEQVRRQGVPGQSGTTVWRPHAHLGRADTAIGWQRDWLATGLAGNRCMGSWFENPVRVPGTAPEIGAWGPGTKKSGGEAGRSQAICHCERREAISRE